MSDHDLEPTLLSTPTAAEPDREAASASSIEQGRWSAPRPPHGQQQAAPEWEDTLPGIGAPPLGPLEGDWRARSERRSSP